MNAIVRIIDGWRLVRSAFLKMGGAVSARQQSMNTYALVSWVSLVFALVPLATLGQPTREVLIVVVQYEETERPVFTSQQWAESLNDRLNTFYQAATQGRAPMFEFVPVPSVLELDFTYESTEDGGLGDTTDKRLYDDPGVMEREGRLALIHARQQVPERFTGPVILYAIVNRDKRGRASGQRPYLTLDDVGGGDS